MQSSRQNAAASSIVLIQEREVLPGASPDIIVRAHEECANGEVPDYSSVDVERRDKRLQALASCFPLDSPIWRVHGAIFKIPEKLSSQVSSLHHDIFKVFPCWHVYLICPLEILAFRGL
jgi:hypothetical protein